MAMDDLMSKMDQKKFQDYIWAFYHTQGRFFVWRNVDDPYKVVISEIMLQQTQTHRVAQKYPQFIELFPDFVTLARASLRDVLYRWQGLGYNRRGKYLHEIAQKVMTEYNGIFPNEPTVLETFPGIGKATAASICAFAFNKSTVFIETNIRTVFIHHFFQHQDQVSDKEIMPLVAQTVDRGNPREWYYALMDYGVMLKRKLPNPSRKSTHHTKQSKFEGSDRQIRGMILRLLTAHQEFSITQLEGSLDHKPERINKAVQELLNEGFITIKEGKMAIKAQ